MDTLTPSGPFSLKAAAEFGFGPTQGRVPAFDGVMRLAFAVDGGTGYAAATLRQTEPDAPVRVELASTAEVYGLDAPPTLEQFREMSDFWRPFRTWATVLVRLGGDRAARARAAGASALPGRSRT